MTFGKGIAEMFEEITHLEDQVLSAKTDTERNAVLEKIDSATSKVTKNYPELGLADYRAVLKNAGIDFTSAFAADVNLDALDVPTVIALIMNAIEIVRNEEGVSPSLVSDDVACLLRRLRALDERESARRPHVSLGSGFLFGIGGAAKSVVDGVVDRKRAFDEEKALREKAKREEQDRLERQRREAEELLKKRREEEELRFIERTKAFALAEEKRAQAEMEARLRAEEERRASEARMLEKRREALEGKDTRALIVELIMEVEDVKSSISSVDESIMQLEDIVPSLSDKLDSLSESLEDLENRVGSLSCELSSISSEIGSLSSEVSSISFNIGI